MKQRTIGRTTSGKKIQSMTLKPGTRRTAKTLNQHRNKFQTSAQRNRTTIKFKRSPSSRAPKPIRTVRASKMPHAAIRRSDWRRGAIRSGKTGNVVKLRKIW